MSSAVRSKDPTGARVKKDIGSQSPVCENSAPNPRAFVCGTGRVFQAVGVTLLVLGVGVWVFAHLFSPPPKSAMVSPLAENSAAQTGRASVWTMALAATVLAGMALMAAGVGLQGEKPRSAVVAMGFAGSFVLIYVSFVLSVVLESGRWATGLALMALAVVNGVLFMLAGHSAAILRRHPPPPDQNIATKEFLEEFRRRRAERLESYDP